MYYFSIPDSFQIRETNRALFHAMQQHKEWFYDDFIIDTVYGTPGHCIWNGNRELFGEPFFRPELCKKVIFDRYKAFGVEYRLVFTNFMLKPEMLHDNYCNQVAEELNAVGGHIMVSTPMFAEYAKKTFPNLKLSWSTTTDFGKTVDEQVAKINELSRDALVVPPYTMNNKPEILDRFEHPENIEILSDEKCIDNCPRRRQHETNSNLYNLYEQVEEGCLMVKDYRKGLYVNNPQVHKVPRAKLSEYVDRGIVHFKIEGRSNPANMLMISYCDYFIMPQYIDNFVDFVNHCMETKFREFSND